MLPADDEANGFDNKADVGRVSPSLIEQYLSASDKIASLTVGDTVLTGADALPAQYVRPQGFYVLLSVDDPMEAERTFHALAEHGEVRMAIHETFWSRRFGVLVDQFGTPWEISCEAAPSVA